jgi:hypothetical protein
MCAKHLCPGCQCSVPMSYSTPREIPSAKNLTGWYWRTKGPLKQSPDCSIYAMSPQTTPEPWPLRQLHGNHITARQNHRLLSLPHWHPETHLQMKIFLYKVTVKFDPDVQTSIPGHKKHKTVRKYDYNNWSQRQREFIICLKRIVK